MRSVLKEGSHDFVLAEWGEYKDVTIKEGFSEKVVKSFKMIWRATGAKQEEHEVYNVDEPAQVEVYGLISSDAKGIEKSAKVGFERTEPWQSFQALFEASGADPAIPGKAVFPSGSPGVVTMEVRAIPGEGSFNPKNTMVLWRTPKKAAESASLFSRAMAGTPAKAVTITSGKKKE